MCLDKCLWTVQRNKCYQHALQFLQVKRYGSSITSMAFIKKNKWHSWISTDTTKFAANDHLDTNWRPVLTVDIVYGTPYMGLVAVDRMNMRWRVIRIAFNSNVLSEEIMSRSRNYRFHRSEHLALATPSPTLPINHGGITCLATNIILLFTSVERFRFF